VVQQQQQQQQQQQTNKKQQQQIKTNKLIVGYNSHFLKSLQ